MRLRGIHRYSIPALLAVALALVCCELVHIRHHIGGRLVAQTWRAKATAEGHAFLHDRPDELSDGTESCPICRGAIAVAEFQQDVADSPRCPADIAAAETGVRFRSLESNIFARGPPAGRRQVRA